MASEFGVFSHGMTGLWMEYNRQMMIETTVRIEPLFFKEVVPTKIADLVAEVQTGALELGRDLHQDAAA